MQAACCIVSSRSNDELDAYVLSESSLFVYPERLILKTCGTTELLAAVPLLLSLAAGLHMFPRHVKYSRASFLFPEKQVRAVFVLCCVASTGLPQGIGCHNMHSSLPAYNCCTLSLQ